MIFSEMQYHGGHDLLIKLSSLLQAHGDPILKEKSTLCLTATSVVFLNHCFELVNSGQQDASEGATKQREYSYRDKEAITFLLDFLRQTPSLRLVAGACSHFDGLINISCFRALQVLEIKKVPVGLVQGFQGLRPQLRTLICKRSLVSLNEVFVHCGGDQLNAPFAWPHLENVDFSFNGIEHLDNSVKLLPKLQVLNLSHNRIQHAEDCESHSLQHLSEVQHLNLGFNRMDGIPVVPSQAGLIKFQLTTLILRNNNLNNMKGIHVFIKLRHLDMSFNCISLLSELTPLAFLHDLISLSLQGNPVVFCPYYRRATIACLYPVPRVEPIKLDGKPLDSEEKMLLGRNVHPVSMLSYIPETPVVPDPRVIAVRKVDDNLVESSESPDELDSVPKKRRQKRKTRKGKRVVAREIDFKEDSEGLPNSEDQTTTPSCPTPSDQLLEHAEDVEKLKKLRQLGGEGWLPSISQVVPDKVVQIPSVESQVDQASSIVHSGSVPSFSDDKLEINSPTSTTSVISDGDFSEAHHYLVTLVSTPDDDNGAAVPLFVTLKGEFVVEKNFVGKVVSQLETSRLQDARVNRTEDDRSVIHLEFDYLNTERRTRDYVMESYEDAVQFADILTPILTASKQTVELAAERYQCLKCSAVFTRPSSSDDLCPDCRSSMTVLVSSPEQNKAVLPPPSNLRSVEDYVKDHAEASSLNKSSIKTLNGDMTITPLVNISSSSSSSSFVEAVDKHATQDLLQTDIEDQAKTNGFLAENKRQVKNMDVTEEERRKENGDDSCLVTDLSLMALDNGVSSDENGQTTEDARNTENIQKKFVITNSSGKYKVASKNEKYVLTKKTINATQVRTSALSNSLMESKVGSKSSSTQRGQEVNGTTITTAIRSKSVENSMNGDGYWSDHDRELRDTVPKLRDSKNKSEEPRWKLSGHRRVTEQPLSRSLPAYRNASLEINLSESRTRKHSNQIHLSEQRKSRQNGNSSDTVQNVNDKSSPQLNTPTSVSRSPTPKMFFSNLMNRLGGRLSGNSTSTSSVESPSSSSGSSRASTPTIEQNVVLSFRLSPDEFQSCDHKLKLFFEVSLFRWGSHEEFSCLLKAPVVIYGQTEETPSLLIASNVMFYVCRFSLRGSGTPDECLTQMVSHPLDDLKFIDSGLGGQSFRFEFSSPGGCYDFLVREKGRCEKFLSLFIDTVQRAKMKAGSKPVVINPPHPQTLEHIRCEVFGKKVEDTCSMGERLRQQVTHFTDPPLIKDRKSLLRSYSSCFVGREFVEWMVRVKEVESRDEAVELGQRLLDEGALEHVSKEHLFEDKDQYYRFNTESDLITEQSLAGDSIPDFDTKIVLFIMGHRCTDTAKPHRNLEPVSVVVSRSHIAMVKQNFQWPVPRYTEMPQDPKHPAFVCLARHKINDVTSVDFYEDDPCFMGISITDEDAPADHAKSQWILKTETVTTLSSLVKVIKDPWEKQFGVELQKNLYPSITEHKL